MYDNLLVNFFNFCKLIILKGTIILKKIIETQGSQASFFDEDTTIFLWLITVVSI